MIKRSMLICAYLLVSWGCGVGVVSPEDPEVVGSAALDDSTLEVAETPDESLLAAPQDDLSGDDAAPPSAEQEGDVMQLFASGAARCRRVCGNCVKYAHCRQRRLPAGLFTYGDKVRIINRWKRPWRGCVAVIKTSHVWGHVAYVTKVSGSRITIAEANWARPCPTTRSGTKSKLRITGFWCPSR